MGQNNLVKTELITLSGYMGLYPLYVETRFFNGDFSTLQKKFFSGNLFSK